MQVARREHASAIEHRVDEDRRDVLTLADHLVELITVNDQDLRRFLGERIAWRIDQPGVGQQPRDIAFPPFHRLVTAGAPVDENGEAT